MHFSSKQAIPVGKIVHAYGRRWKVTECFPPNMWHNAHIIRCVEALINE